MIKVLIEKGADIHKRDENGHTPLWWAIGKNEREIAELLKGADVHEEDEDEPDHFYWAICKRNIEIVKGLIEEGADIHERDENGHTPLWWAIRRNKREIAKVLIEKGADIHAKDCNGYTPLYYAKTTFFRKEIIRAYVKSCLINNLAFKRPSDLPSDLSNFWNECQSQLKQLIEKRPHLISLILLDDENELVTAMSRVFRESEETLEALKSLSSSQHFVDVFGTQLQEGATRYERLNDCSTRR